MNRIAATLALLLSLTPLGAAPAGAKSISGVAGYFHLRASGPVNSAPFETIRLHPDHYRSSLIEIRGTVTGNARRPDGATVVLTTAGTGTFMIEVSGDIASQALDAGQTVRVLARVPEGVVIGHLLLAAATTEYEAASYEAEHPRSAPVAAARTSGHPATGSSRAGMPRSRMTRRQLASRGGTALRSESVLEQYAQAVIYFNGRLSWDQAMRIAQSILVYSIHYGLDARLVMAVIAVESNFNAYAVSPKGAMGLGQLMPGTAVGLGVGDPWSPEENIEGATRLLSGHLLRMSATQPTEEAIKLALACYNAGAGAVKKHNGIPPYRETKAYVQKVTRLYYQMCGQPPP